MAAVSRAMGEYADEVSAAGHGRGGLARGPAIALAEVRCRSKACDRGKERRGEGWEVPLDGETGFS